MIRTRKPSPLFLKTISFKDAAQRGYTLPEILVSVSLMIVLMFIVAKVFQKFGTIVNDTQSSMGIATELRNVKDKLDFDLKRVSVPMTPPINSQSNLGYFSYVEGLGAPHTRVLEAMSSGRNIYNGLFLTSEIAKDSDRKGADTTIGDLDDLLMFTIRAKPGESFRGRFLEPYRVFDNNGNAVMDANGNPVYKVRETMLESEYAEVIWFVRGTTLYRRLLLIIPDNLLQESLNALQNNIDPSDSPASSEAAALQSGYGFFRYYDVSVHLNNGRVVANTLGDLGNRANRYGIWSSYVNSNNATLHGTYGAWYWLRMPTLQESASSKFLAGVSYGNINESNANYLGSHQLLTAVSNNQASNALPTNEITDAVGTLGTPFLDYWNDPNGWLELSGVNGNLKTLFDSMTDTVFTQDVLMPNVISFNVRAWDPEKEEFVDLGVDEGVSNIEGNSISHKMLRSNATSLLTSLGHYNGSNSLNAYDGEGNQLVTPFIPAVYDTWTEQYDVENIYRNLSMGNSTNSNIPLNGLVDSSNLPNYPPPYDVELKGLQIEIRAFDRKSMKIKNITLDVAFDNGATQ